MITEATTKLTSGYCCGFGREEIIFVLWIWSRKNYICFMDLVDKKFYLCYGNFMQICQYFMQTLSGSEKQIWFRMF